MEQEFRAYKENPKENRNIISKLLFTWMFNTFYVGSKVGISITDLFIPLKEDCSKRLGDKLQKNWNEELQNSKITNKEPSLTKAILNTFLPLYMVYGFLLFIQHVCLKTLIPLVLGYLLQLFNGTKQVENLELAKYIASLILVVLMALAIFFYHHTAYGQQKIGMRVRIALSSLIYRKITKLSTKSLHKISSGELVNLLSNDVQRFDSVATALHSIWIVPFQIAVVTYFLWDKVGVVCLAGILSMVFLMLVQAAMGRMASKIRSKVAAKTDYRVNLMNEIVTGIQVIKMYAWEKPFEKLVGLARIDEVKAIKTANYVRAIFLSSMVFIERTTLFFTVLAYVLTDNVLTSDTVFVVAQFLNVLQSAVAVMLPLAIQSGAESLVSIRRIKTVLLLEEKSHKNLQTHLENAVELIDVTAGYEEVILDGINLKIPKGALCMIIGNVGSGKSSILNLLLQELELKSGEVKIDGNVSYSSQESWIFNSSVRNNITFGSEYEDQHYKNITDACALETDFSQFPHHDLTMISEKGHSLSGGQKARINLARSVYRQADIYLLDDPLSAVDAHVAKHIFNECVLVFLKGKTRILVTHQTQFLNKADFVVIMKDGKIDFHGTFEEFSKANTAFSSASEEFNVENEQLKNTRKLKKVIRKSTGSLRPEEEKVDYKINAILKYIKSSGNGFALGILFCVLIGTQLACNSADFWISHWTSMEEAQTPKDISTNDSLYIYSGIIASIILFTIIRSYLFFDHASIASKNLHDKMFTCLLRLPMRFFNENSSGRILNRFSKDTGAMDEILPKVLSETIHVILVMIGSFVLIIIANVWMTIAIAILVIIFIGVRRWFLVTAKSIKHVEGIAKSPVFSFLNSTLSGLTTIRAVGCEEKLVDEFDDLQDVHTSAWFLLLSCMTSFGLWLDLLCVLFLACIVFSFVPISESTTITGAMVGLAITQAIGLTGMIQYGMMQVADVINQFTSVERILYYTTLKKEDTQDSLTESQNLSGWPEKGRILFKDVSLKYNSPDKVLKELNFEIPAGEKIGIVGRTGAGKSSIISVLFRLFDIEGMVSIDEVDIQNLNLSKLRSKISIIPQDPILFSNTIRFNLDPFGEHQDEELWKALSDVELKSVIPNLQYQIREGGSNLSVGQRQLICLARALIRKNKILILDEATANVDMRTDNLIQETIRRNFKNYTVLSIAHRLNTVADSDKILVMDNGNVVEFDHPYLLLQNTEGYFYSMVQDTGHRNASNLLQTCKTQYELINRSSSKE